MNKKTDQYFFAQNKLVLSDSLLVSTLRLGFQLEILGTIICCRSTNQISSDRHENEDKPLVETWLMRPNNDIVEFHIILQNYQLVFEILPNGNVNLIEKVIKDIGLYIGSAMI